MQVNENRPAKFAGAARYVLDEELAKIVNISMALEMPLLLKGEPGTGKTMLAHAIAESLRMPLIVLNVKSSMKLIDQKGGATFYEIQNGHHILPYRFRYRSL